VIAGNPKISITSFPILFSFFDSRIELTPHEVATPGREDEGGAPDAVFRKSVRCVCRAGWWKRGVRRVVRSVVAFGGCEPGYD